MLNQEDYVKVLDLHRQGWSNKEIAVELGYHPATIAKHLKGGPSARRVVPDEDGVMNRRWRQRIEQLLEANPRLLAVSVFNKIRAEGYTGSYPSTVRAVRAVRGPRFRAAPAVSVPIHTDPGEEAQFDFCDLSGSANRWGWSTPLFCFGAILCWSRIRLWWFTTSQDRQHTFEGLVRLFESVAGVPAVCRTDRMGALGTSPGGLAAEQHSRRRAARSRCHRRLLPSGHRSAPRRRFDAPVLPDASLGRGTRARRRRRPRPGRLHDLISPTNDEGAVFLYHRLLSTGLRLAATAGGPTPSSPSRRAARSRDRGRPQHATRHRQRQGPAKQRAPVGRARPSHRHRGEHPATRTAAVPRRLGRDAHRPPRPRQNGPSGKKHPEPCRPG